MAIASKTQDRDGQHSELTKIRTQQEEGRSELERQREVLYKLTQQISATEQTLNRVREGEGERKKERGKRGRGSKDGNIRKKWREGDCEFILVMERRKKEVAFSTHSLSLYIAMPVL